jgi:hypothetical protein
LRPSGDPAPALARASKAFGPSRTTSPIGMSLVAPWPPLAEAEGPEATPAGGWNAPRGAPVRYGRGKKPRRRYPSGQLPPG